MVGPVAKTTRQWTAADEGALNGALERHRAGDLAAAEAGYRKLLRRHPRHSGALAMLGALLLQSGDGVSASRALKAAIEAGARDAGVFNNYALALTTQGKHAAAIAALEKSVALKPDGPEAHLNLGNALKNAGRAEDAAAGLEKALGTNPGFVPLHIALGNVRANLGARQAAIAAYRHALELDPGNANAFYHLALVSKAGAEAVAPATAAAFRDAVAADKPPRDDAILVHYALGVIDDRAASYDAAFGHFSAANELALEGFDERGARFDPAAHAAGTDRLIETYSTAFFAARPSAGRASQRPLLIVGMPRSGTTLVEQILDSHPDCVGAGELDELAAIARQVDARPGGVAGLDRKAGQRLADRYLGRLRAFGGAAARVCDKQPTNFRHLGLVARLLPGTRVVHCVRDPLDTCLSCYFQNFSGGIRFASDLADLGAYYRDYDRLMTHWRRVLAVPIFDLSYEALVDDRERVTRELVAFAGLPWDDACLAYERNPRAVRTASNIQVREPIYRSSVARWRNYETHIAPLRDALGV